MPNFASARDSGYYRHAKFFEQGDDVPLPVRWRYKLDRWRSQIAAMFHSEPKQLRPRLCPACGTLVGATATKCHQCGANMTFSFAAASRSLGRWMPQTSPVTYAMLAICCVMYGLSFVITMKLSGGEGARRRLDESRRNRQSGQLSLGRIASIGLQHQPALALRHGDFSSRRAAAHRLQYVGADGYRADGRGIVRLGAIFVLVRCDGRWRIRAQFLRWATSASALQGRCLASSACSSQLQRAERAWPRRLCAAR